ncbi:MAG: transcriptional repressor LexA [bacterium]|nr:transcriptional repressor LexA [bacterium]
MKKIPFSIKELEAIRHIYNSMMQRGESPSMRELMVSMGYQSPRSISIIIDGLIEKKILQRKLDGKLRFLKNIPDDKANAQTVDVPLIGTVAAGTPMLAEENIEMTVPVSTKLARPPHRYFLLKVEGDSMNEKNINNGDLVLVRQQTTAENGDIVVALIDKEATIKEFHSSPNAIVLKPKSKNKKHKPIVLNRDFHIQGKVITSIPNVTDE